MLRLSDSKQLVTESATMLCSAQLKFLCSPMGWWILMSNLGQLHIFCGKGEEFPSKPHLQEDEVFISLELCIAFSPVSGKSNELKRLT